MAALLAEELDACAGRTDDLVRLCRTVCARADVRYVLGSDEDLIEAARVAFDDWLAVIEAGEARVRWLPRPAARRSERSGRRLRALVTEHVARREPADGLLDEIRAEVPDPAEQTDAAFTLLFSAQGLPGVTMSWLLLELAAHPEHAEALRAELAGRSVAEAGALPLTGAFVHEVLRLHPPQWLVSRVSSQPAELAGHTVPAGQQVLISPYLIHRDKRYWDDPDTFDPSRWLSGRRPAKAFMPFGAGPRYCPGSSLAMTQLVALVALFVTSYEFDLETAGTPDHRGLLMPAGARGSWRSR
jgi:unspecific monooxygenase